MSTNWTLRYIYQKAHAKREESKIPKIHLSIVKKQIKANVSTHV